MKLDGQYKVIKLVSNRVSFLWGLLSENATYWLADKPQKFISHGSRTREFKIRTPAWSGSGEGPLLGRIALTLHCVFTW